MTNAQEQAYDEARRAFRQEISERTDSFITRTGCDAEFSLHKSGNEYVVLRRGKVVGRVWWDIELFLIGDNQTPIREQIDSRHSTIEKCMETGVIPDGVTFNRVMSHDGRMLYVEGHDANARWDDWHKDSPYYFKADHEPRFAERGLLGNDRVLKR